MAGISIRNLTRRPTPRLPYDAALRRVLPGWEVSLVFVGPAEARALNERLRGKAYVPNVLSYAAGTRSGEIIICLAEAGRQAPAYGVDARMFVLYLLIHGLLHLKGVPHGATMERSERGHLARLAKGVVRNYSSLHGSTNRNRHRHRHAPGQAGRRRRTR
ncbi:MAG TPA: rRNA maturation RNase YbeY [Candidatus Paceibacterota bacterium]|nr:rRNA maturation RNase YbeY [Candidatus Paceibacterota bacterium]